MSRSLAALSLLLVAAGGCATATGAYTDGMEHEVAGDYVRAADAYATALERDPRLGNVPGRLAVAGREAVRQHVARARAAEPEPAALEYQAAAALVRRAERLGVEVVRPPSFDEDLARARRGAVAWLTDAADAGHAAGDFASASDRLRRATGFCSDPVCERRIEELRLDILVGWSHADLDAGRYRSALSRADAALALDARLGALDLRDDILDLQAAILDLGTVVAALLPTEGDGQDAVFLRDLDDVLADGLAPPPPFVALVDPADVRRWDRRDRAGRRVDLSDSPRRLADAAGDLGADVGVVVFARPVTDESVVGETRRQSVERRGGGRADLWVQQVRLTLSVRADLTAAQAGGGTVCERTAQARATETYDRATADADPSDLVLDRRQRAALSDDAGDRASDRARADLRDRLAAALATRVAECLEAQVP